MRVLELPKPLFPLNPVLAPQQPRLPKALGDVFVGNPRLKLPEIQAQAPKEPAASKSTLVQEPAPTKAEGLAYTAAATPAKTEESRLGLQVDLKA